MTPQGCAYLQFCCCTCKLCNLCFMPQQASISTSLTPPHLKCIKFGSVLLGTWREFVMTRLKGRKCSNTGELAYCSPWAFKSRINTGCIVLLDYRLKMVLITVARLSADGTVWWREIKKKKIFCLGMHLDFSWITQHLCEAMPYLCKFDNTEMDELYPNHCIL